MKYFKDEIREQPQALKNTISFYFGEGRSLLDKLSLLWKSGKYDQVIFTGMGSSFFASGYAASQLNKAGIRSLAVNAGELLHYQFPMIQKNSLLVCISQSGESYEVVKLLEKLPTDITCLGITNESESTLAKKAHLALVTKAGKEEYTSTKTFVTTCLLLNILSLVITDHYTAEKKSEMVEMADSVEKIMQADTGWLSRAMELLDHAGFVQIIGRGPVYATLQQSALMFMEAARNPCAAMLGGEFRHGPMEMVKEGFKAIIVAPDGDTFSQSNKLAKDIIGFGGKVIWISNRKPELDHPALFYISIPFLHEDLFLIPAIIPLQFIVNEWAISKGNIPGVFTRGAKVTIIE